MTQKPEEISGLAGRLREARINSGLSQGQSSSLLKMHRPTLSNIESGERKVTAGELQLFADLYKVSVDWLMGRGIERDQKVKLAARKLGALKDKDLETVMRIIDGLRRTDR